MGNQSISNKHRCLYARMNGYSTLVNNIAPGKYIVINRIDYSFLFVCFGALRPKSTAMVMAGRSVHLTTLFPWQA